MARSRNIKPGFFTNDALADLPPLTRLLFIGLWTLVDRDGRIEDRPKKIKAECMPYDDMDPDEALAALAGAGFLLRYQVGEVRCIQVQNWCKHQNPHVKEGPSTLPQHGQSSASTRQAPDKHQTSTELARLIPDSGFRIPDSSPLIPDSKAKTARKRAAPSALVSLQDLVAEGVDKQHATDWLAARKAKRLPLTPTAWSETKAEATKAGLSPHDAIARAAKNGWAGFKASWPDPGDARAGPGRQNGSHVGAMSEHGLQTMRNAEALEARLFGGTDASQ